MEDTLLDQTAAVGRNALITVVGFPARMPAGVAQIEPTLRLSHDMLSTLPGFRSAWCRFRPSRPDSTTTTTGTVAREASTTTTTAAPPGHPWFPLSSTAPILCHVACNRAGTRTVTITGPCNCAHLLARIYDSFAQSGDAPAPSVCFFISRLFQGQPGAFCLYAIISSVTGGEIMVWLDFDEDAAGPRTLWIDGPTDLPDILERLGFPYPVGYGATLNGAIWGGERTVLAHGDVIQIRRQGAALVSFPLDVLHHRIRGLSAVFTPFPGPLPDLMVLVSFALHSGRWHV